MIRKSVRRSARIAVEAPKTVADRCWGCFFVGPSRLCWRRDCGFIGEAVRVEASMGRLVPESAEVGANQGLQWMLTQQSPVVYLHYLQSESELHRRNFGIIINMKSKHEVKT